MALNPNELKRRFRFAALRAEPALALALQRLENGNIASSLDALRAALDTLHLLGPSIPEEHSFPAALKSLERQLDSDRVEFNSNGDATCRVDPDAVSAAVRTAINNAALSADAALMVELDATNDPPMIELSFDGPGSIPNTWFIGGVVPASFDEMKIHWTRHTLGGRLDRTENGVALKLAGQREPEPNPKPQEAVLAAVTDAERVLKLAASTDAGGVPEGTTIQTALNIIDDEFMVVEPSDMCALLRELALEGRGVDLQCSESIPPIAIRRDRIAASMERLCDLAQPRIDAGASITMITEYNAADCTAEVECSFPRSGQDVAWQAACAALERIVDALHDGVCIVDLGDVMCNVSMTLPDTIGAAIEKWIPGYSAFADRSIQMLRLLKSGGQAPPEDLILGGVLESELERWLLPKLEASAAVNVAHELEKGKNPPRLAKALGQIRRGKPKKEICAPQYARDIIAAYRSDERGRRAIGLDTLDTIEIDSLFDGLKSEPLGYVTCLRLLVKITHAASD